MRDYTNKLDLPTYHLIIPHAQARDYRVLLVRDENGYWMLPHFRSAYDNFAMVRHINDWVWQQYGLYVVTLRCLDAYHEVETGEHRFYVMDNLHPEWQASEDMGWYREDEVKVETLLDPLQKEMILRWFDWRHSESSLRVQWMRRGWFSDAGYWMVDLADRMAMGGIQTVEQEEVWSRSCTMRLATDDGLLYMKAVPEILNYEPVVTRVLSLRYPGFVPDVRAVHVENGWMLTRDFGGQALSHFDDLEIWKRALRNYADIQVDLIGSTQSLVALGVPDRNVDYLASQIDRLMVHLPEDLSEQERRDLRRISPDLKLMCFDLTEHKIPLSLTHGDLWSGNVRVHEDGSNLFYDWSDASVSHPFFDLPLFLAEIDAIMPQQPDAKAQLLDVYFSAWTRYAPKSTLRQVYAIAEVLAYLHQALFYHTHILPHIEADARWEMETMLSPLLRQVLASARVYRL